MGARHAGRVGKDGLGIVGTDLVLGRPVNESSVEKTIGTKAGKITYQEFYSRNVKSLIDDIDRALADHYGFTDEELDFIINYDIKYRMGGEAAG